MESDVPKLSGGRAGTAGATGAAGKTQHQSTGATMSPTYLQREMVVVGVNRNDLEDLLEFNGLEALLSGFGLFLLSGALWLGVERVFSQEKPFDDTLFVVCMISCLFGFFLLVLGVRMRLRKQSRINRIFSETTPLTGTPFQAPQASATGTTR